MESFTNFQFDTASQYGGALLDDAVSVVSGFTQSQQDLTEDPLADQVNGHKHKTDEDLDGVLDDFKDGPVDLPPYACR